MENFVIAICSLNLLKIPAQFVFKHVSVRLNRLAKFTFGYFDSFSKLLYNSLMV